MKILYITETESGCYKVRSKLPAKYLRRLGHEVQIISHEKQLSNLIIPDVAVFFRGFAGNVKPTIEFFKKIGIKTVYDIDDALDIISKDSPHYFENKLLAGESIKYLPRGCQLITTTTQHLASHLKQFNYNVTVLPNCIDPEEWHRTPLQKFRRRQIQKKRRVRIGFSGGASHLRDLMLVIPVLKDLQTKYEFDFIIQGFTTIKSFQEWYDFNVKVSGQKFLETEFAATLAEFLKMLESLNYQFEPYVPIEKHHKKVMDMNLDIGICPLEETRFNKNKSCIKFYEYAMSGAATLASNVLPYKEEVDYVTDNTPDSWQEKLEKLIVDASFRQLLAAKQKAWVLENRDISKQVVNWVKAYEGIR